MTPADIARNFHAAHSVRQIFTKKKKKKGRRGRGNSPIERTNVAKGAVENCGGKYICAGGFEGNDAIFPAANFPLFFHAHVSCPKFLK